MLTQIPPGYHGKGIRPMNHRSLFNHSVTSSVFLWPTHPTGLGVPLYPPVYGFPSCVWIYERTSYPIDILEVGPVLASVRTFSPPRYTTGGVGPPKIIPPPVRVVSLYRAVVLDP